MIVSKSYPWSKAGTRFLGIIGLLSLVGTATSAVAQDMSDTLQVHGFLSQALVVTDDNNFFGPSSESGGSTEFTEVGVNFSVRPHEDVLVAAQVLSRRAGSDGSEAKPELDYGVIDFQALSNQQRNIGLQLGRFKNPFGFYNQTRDVAFTRPSILLPQSIYFDRTRSLGLAGDGASIYYEERLDSGTLRTQVGFGEAQAGNDLETTLKLDQFSGSLESKNSAIAQILYEHGGGKFLVGLSAGYVDAEFDSEATGTGDFRFQPTVFSLQYNDELWSITGEYALRQSSMKNFKLQAANFDFTGHSWYLQYTRRFLDDWQWLLRYDKLISNIDDPAGNEYQATGAGPAHSQFAKDITTGIQWRMHPNILFSAEFHHVDGTGWLPLQDNSESYETNRYWNMLLTQLSLRF